MIKRLLTLITLLGLLAACSSQDISKDIIGSWYGDSLRQDIVFFADGRVLLKDRKYSTYTGHYMVSDDDRLTVHIDSPVFSKPIIRQVIIQGDKLTLIDHNDREEIYRR